MANYNPDTSNLIKNSDLSPEELRQKCSNGGKKSGEVRRKKAELKKTLESILLEIGDKKNNLTYEQMSALWLIANSINKNKGGNPYAYKMIKETLGQDDEETKTRMVEIKVVDNSHLEKKMYEKK